jgi:hypothetical protein
MSRIIPFITGLALLLSFTAATAGAHKTTQGKQIEDIAEILENKQLDEQESGDDDHEDDDQDRDNDSDNQAIKDKGKGKQKDKGTKDRGKSAGKGNETAQENRARRDERKDIQDDYRDGREGDAELLEDVSDGKSSKKPWWRFWK